MNSRMSHVQIVSLYVIIVILIIPLSPVQYSYARSTVLARTGSAFPHQHKLSHSP